MSSWLRVKLQMRLAFNSLRHAPVFSLSVLVTMALSLFSVFLVFSIVNTYYVKPLKVLDENHLYVLEQEVDTVVGKSSGYQSYQAIAHWYQTQTVFEHVSMVAVYEFLATNLPGQPKLISSYVTQDYAELFQVPLLKGQWFKGDIQITERSNQAVISERVWRDYFNADENVLGRKVEQGPDSFTIIGVISSIYESPFMFSNGRSDIWLHSGDDMRLISAMEGKGSWSNTYGAVKIIGQLKADLDYAQMYQQLDDSIESIRSVWHEQFDQASDFRPLLTSYRVKELGDNGKFSLFVLVGVLGLLSTAVGNVANLFVSRAVAQTNQLALQAVLGAKRRVLFQSVLLETLILMTIAVMIATFLTAWGIKLFKFLFSGNAPLIQSISLDFNFLLLAVTCCVVLAIFFAFVTSSVIDYRSLNSQVRNSGKGSVHQVSSLTVRLVMFIQVTVASTLIFFTGLALTHVHQSLNRTTGETMNNRYSVMAFSPDVHRVSSPQERYENFARLKQLVLDAKYVRKVSTGNSPLVKNIIRTTINDTEGNFSPFTPYSVVGQDFFSHSGLNILRGRTFSDAAMRGEVKEFLVTQAMAERLDPEGDVVGKHYYWWHERIYELVGVTENFYHPTSYEQDNGAYIWWPSSPRNFQFIIEVEEGHELNRKDFLDLLRTDDPDIKLWSLESLEANYNDMVYMDRLVLYLCYLLAVFALVLGSVGIFGMLTYNVGIRRVELGLRIALGAKRRRIYQLVMQDALMPLFAGLITAVCICALVYLTFEATLEQWLSFNLIFMILILAMIMGVGAYACSRPVYRLLQQKPMAVLQQ